MKTYISFLLQFVAAKSSVNITPLIQWLERSGAQMKEIEIIEERENMRTVLAKSDIKKGERLLFIPYDNIITMEKAKSSPIGSQMDEKDLVPGGYRLNHAAVSLLAVFLLEEKKKG